MAALALTNWNTGLFDCCDDYSSCCYGFWCCPCFACTTTGKFGESRCLPLLDICSPAITAACGIPLCVPPAALSLRVAIRHKYGIKGSLCKDIMTSCFCEWCSWCQMARELKHRKKGHVKVNIQPQPVVVNMQPPPTVKTS
ncbi:cornifelin homolog A-like [Centroberyx gerrardi]